MSASAKKSLQMRILKNYNYLQIFRLNNDWLAPVIDYYCLQSGLNDVIVISFDEKKSLLQAYGQ